MKNPIVVIEVVEMTTATKQFISILIVVSTVIVLAKIFLQF
jgi:hypothetical protein